MSGIFTGWFWKRAIERAAKSAAQGVVAAVPVSAVSDLSVWEGALVLGPGLFALSVLTSIASSTVGDGNDPSLVA